MDGPPCHAARGGNSVIGGAVVDPGGSGHLRSHGLSGPRGRGRRRQGPRLARSGRAVARLGVLARARAAPRSRDRVRTVRAPGSAAPPLDALPQVLATVAPVFPTMEPLLEPVQPVLQPIGPAGVMTAVEPVLEAVASILAAVEAPLEALAGEPPAALAVVCLLLLPSGRPCLSRDRRCAAEAGQEQESRENQFHVGGPGRVLSMHPGTTDPAAGCAVSRGSAGPRRATAFPAGRAALFSPPFASATAARPPGHGDVAQLVERCVRNAEVVGSSPIVSTSERGRGRPGLSAGNARAGTRPCPPRGRARTSRSRAGARRRRARPARRAAPPRARARRGRGAVPRPGAGARAG